MKRLLLLVLLLVPLAANGQPPPVQQQFDRTAAVSMLDSGAVYGTFQTLRAAGTSSTIQIPPGITQHTIAWYTQGNPTTINITISGVSNGASAGITTSTSAATSATFVGSYSSITFTLAAFTANGIAIDAGYSGVALTSAKTDALGADTYVAYWQNPGLLSGDSGFRYNQDPTQPTVSLTENDQAANAQWWASAATGGTFTRSACDNTGANCIAYETVTRSGTTVTTWAFSASTSYTFNTGQILAAAGTALLPSISFAGDTNTGLFNNAADAIQVILSGAGRFRFTTAALLTEGVETLGTSGSPITGANVVTYFGSSGTGAAPTYSFYGDTDTGIYNISANAVEIGLAGAGHYRFTASSLLPEGSETFGSTGSRWAQGWFTVVSINTSGTTAQLNVDGDVRMTGLTTSGSTQAAAICKTTDASGGQLIAASVNCIASSLRWKHGIEPLDMGLETVLKLKPRMGFYNDPEYDPSPDGLPRPFFVAEEVAVDFPRLTLYDSEGRPRGIEYETYTAVLTKAIQELYAKVQELENKEKEKR